MKLIRLVLLFLTLTICPAMAEEPALAVDWEFRQRSGQHETVITIRNTSDREVKVSHPDSRCAVAFIVVDDCGNLLQPEGVAKVDPQDGKIVIRPGKIYEYIDEQRTALARSKGLVLPFLTDTGLFAYQLKKGARYRATAIYRPYGEQSEGIASGEHIFVHK